MIDRKQIFHNHKRPDWNYPSCRPCPLDRATLASGKRIPGISIAGQRAEAWRTAAEALHQCNEMKNETIKIRQNVNKTKILRNELEQLM